MIEKDALLLEVVFKEQQYHERSDKRANGADWRTKLSGEDASRLKILYLSGLDECQ